MIVKTRRLGLAAYMKMKGALLTGVEGNYYCFDSDKSESTWILDYSNSCCHTHDTELVNLRKLRKK